MVSKNDMTKMVKKGLVTLVMLCFLHGYAQAWGSPFAVWDGETGALTTGKHNIFISKDFNGYRCQVWNDIHQ